MLRRATAATAAPAAARTMVMLASQCPAMEAKGFASPLWIDEAGMHQLGAKPADGAVPVEAKTVKRLELFNVSQCYGAKKTLRYADATIPTSASTGKPYSAAVSTILEEATERGAYDSQLWVTRQQAAVQGLAINRNTTPTLVITETHAPFYNTEQIVDGAAVLAAPFSGATGAAYVGPGVAPLKEHMQAGGRTPGIYFSDKQLLRMGLPVKAGEVPVRLPVQKRGAAFAGDDIKNFPVVAKKLGRPPTAEEDTWLVSGRPLNREWKDAVAGKPNASKYWVSSTDMRLVNSFAIKGSTSVRLTSAVEGTTTEVYHISQIDGDAAAAIGTYAW